MFWSIVIASTLFPAAAPTSAALLTVISCVSAARSSTSRCGDGGRAAMDGELPPGVLRAVP